MPQRRGGMPELAEVDEITEDEGAPSQTATFRVASASMYFQQFRKARLMLKIR